MRCGDFFVFCGCEKEKQEKWLNKGFSMKNRRKCEFFGRFRRDFDADTRNWRNVILDQGECELEGKQAFLASGIMQKPNNTGTKMFSVEFSCFFAQNFGMTRVFGADGLSLRRYSYWAEEKLTGTRVAI